jgi:hypothetical protein
MTRHHSRAPLTLLLAATIAAALSTACTDQADSAGASSTPSTGAPTAKQRIAIEERWQDGTVGTFKLIPLSKGPVKADSGTFTFPAAVSTVTIKDGQTVTTYNGTDTLDGRNGTLTIPNIQRFTDVGSSYQTGAGAWSISDGTGSYRRLHGGGGGSTVATPDGIVLTRYEGYVGAG